MQAFQCCLFDHLETEIIPLEAKWYFGDCTKGSVVMCKLHKALTNEVSLSNSLIAVRKSFLLTTPDISIKFSIKYNLMSIFACIFIRCY